MTVQLTDEGWYLYQERLGILCEDKVPTPRQHDIALGEALGWDMKFAKGVRRTKTVTAPKSPIEDAE